jgi:DNA polymerase-1
VVFPVKKRVILVDADTILYRHATTRQQIMVIDEGDGWPYYLQWADHVPIWDGFMRDIVAIGKAWDAHPMICLTDSATNWRTVRLWDGYKGNRHAPKPIALKPIRALLAERDDAVLRPSLEADDVIGIMATRKAFLKAHSEVLIWSHDKDLLTIPGLHASVKEEGSTFLVTEDEADHQWWLQTLTGDTSDGYPGLPGYGPVTAAKWLAKHGATWESVRQAFLEKGLTEEDALLQARLARILRATDYDFINKEVLLWTP